MSTYLKVLVFQYHLDIPHQSMSLVSASTVNPTESQAEGTQAQVLLLLPIWEEARAKQEALNESGSGRRKRDGERRA